LSNRERVSHGSHSRGDDPARRIKGPIGCAIMGKGGGLTTMGGQESIQGRERVAKNRKNSSDGSHTKKRTEKGV